MARREKRKNSKRVSLDALLGGIYGGSTLAGAVLTGAVGGRVMRESLQWHAMMAPYGKKQPVEAFLSYLTRDSERTAKLSISRRAAERLAAFWRKAGTPFVQITSDASAFGGGFYAPTTHSVGLGGLEGSVTERAFIGLHELAHASAGKRIARVSPGLSVVSFSIPYGRLGHELYAIRRSLRELKKVGGIRAVRRVRPLVAAQVASLGGLAPTIVGFTVASKALWDYVIRGKRTTGKLDFPGLVRDIGVGVGGAAALAGASRLASTRPGLGAAIAASAAVPLWLLQRQRTAVEKGGQRHPVISTLGHVGAYGAIGAAVGAALGMPFAARKTIRGAFYSGGIAGLTTLAGTLVGLHQARQASRNVRVVGPQRGASTEGPKDYERSQAAKRAWRTRRMKYGPRGHRR